MYEGQRRAGDMLAVASAVGLGLAIAVSRFAYEGGTNGLTVAGTRGVVLLCGLVLFCLLTGRSLRIPFRTWLHCAGLGLCMTMMFYGNVGAVEFISVGLAALLFFTFPPIIAVLNAVVLREQVSWPKALAVAVSFVGIALMLGVSLQAVDPRGVALSLGAGLATAINAVWLGRKLRNVDTLVATAHMATVAAAMLLLLVWLSGGPQWPTAPVGWGGLFGVVALQACSVPLYFMAIPRAGALRTGMITNVQPVTSIVAAFLFFGEVLTAVQALGGLLVLGGIWLMQWHDARVQRRAALQ